MRDYATALLANPGIDEVFRMELTPPPGPYPFVNPMNPPGCQQQVIWLNRTAPGVYQYHCDPPWSELVGKCRCGDEERKKRRVRIPKPFPVPIGVPSAAADDAAAADAAAGATGAEEGVTALDVIEGIAEVAAAL